MTKTAMTKTAVNPGVRPVDVRGAYPVVKTTVAAYPQSNRQAFGNKLDKYLIQQTRVQQTRVQQTRVQQTRAQLNKVQHK